MSSNGLIEHTRLNTIKFGQIPIDHDLNTADQINSLRNIIYVN